MRRDRITTRHIFVFTVHPNNEMIKLSLNKKKVILGWKGKVVFLP